MNIETILKEFHTLVQESGIIQRSIFSFVLVYGSLTLAFALLYVLSFFRRLNIKNALEITNIFLIDLILLIMLTFVTHISGMKELVFIAGFFVIILSNCRIIIGKKLSHISPEIYEAVTSLTGPGIESAKIVDRSYLIKEFPVIIKKYHIYFWIVLLTAELLNEEISGLGSVFRMTFQFWNSSLLISFVLYLCVFFLLIHYIIRFITGKFQVIEENGNE